MPPTPDLPVVAAAEAALLVSHKTHSLSCSIPVACTPATVFAVWSEVERWHTWDPDTKWARLDQAFAAGGTGRLAPQRGLAVNFTITELTADRGFSVQCRVLGNRMIFEHSLQTAQHGIVVTHRARFEGWASNLLLRTVGRDVQRGLPLTLTRLKHVCEARQLAGVAPNGRP